MVTIGSSDMPPSSSTTQIMKRSQVLQTVSETYIQLDDVEPYIGHQGQVRAQAWT